VKKIFVIGASFAVAEARAKRRRSRRESRLDSRPAENFYGNAARVCLIASALRNP
jgi:hypothetical protein